MANYGFSQNLITEAVLVLVFLGITALVSTHDPHLQNKKTLAMMEAVLKNRKVVKTFVNCYLDLGPCTNQAQQAKEYFQQLLVTKCSNCTQEQKKTMKKFFSTFYSKYREDYNKIVEKYDPNHEYSDEFLAWFTDDC